MIRDKAIRNLYPSVVSIDNETDAFDKDNILVVLDEELVNQEYNRLVQEDNSLNYQRLRKVEYPSIGDQLDMLWHSMDENETTKIEPFYSSIKTIKDKYPKIETQENE